ncbi:MAG: glycosyltransferase family 4 protein [Chitinophagaceae bacterium]
MRSNKLPEMNYLFLYTELADYFIACLSALKEQEPDCSITVIHYPVNPEAPFLFDNKRIGTFRVVTEFTGYQQLSGFVRSVKPDKILVSGWINKSYLRIAFEWRKKACCIMSMDTHWKGLPKQRIMVFAGKLLLSRIFRVVWVPGEPQVLYAKKLGFQESRIRKGFYCCDTPRFVQLGKDVADERGSSPVPKRLLCVARYIPSKGYDVLWEAFVEWHKLEPNEWELWCAGTGEGFNNRLIHSRIKHLGFVQKDQWRNVVAGTSVFVLNSTFEPWGVAVHEFAATGFPLILTDAVGAGAAFLGTENGWKVPFGNKEALMNAFRELNSLSDEALLEKGRKSRALAEKITPLGWGQTFRSV